MKSVLANDRLRLSITDTCNFSCFYCTNEGQTHNKHLYLDVDFVAALVEKIKEEDIYIRKLNITGGEPSLHPRLDDIIQLLLPVSESVTLNTNGSLLTPQRIRQLFDSGIANIKFGIDSFFNEKTKPIMGKPVCDNETVIQNLLYAVRLNPRSSANIVLTAFNLDGFDDVLDFIMEHNLNWVEILQYIEFDFRGDNQKAKPVRGLVDLIHENINRFKEVTYNYELAKFICTTHEDLVVQFAEDFCHKRVCQNLWTRVSANGSLTPCIKSREELKIDFNQSLSEQITRCNELMCNGIKNHIPRNYQGDLVDAGENGPYHEPGNLEEMIPGIKITHFDP